MAAGKKDKPKAKTSKPAKSVANTAAGESVSRKAHEAVAPACKKDGCKPAAKDGKKAPANKAGCTKQEKTTAKPGNGEPPDPAEKARQEAIVIEEKKKLHRDIFMKCVEKKMLQELDFWGS